MVKATLAGFNLDKDGLEQVMFLLEKEKSKEALKILENLTPETISSAYARISRDPRSVDKLRKIARKNVRKARISNQTIVFDMSHHSVAEHASLNFDITKISRLAIEALEERRLASYTEKSQRYITLDRDFVTPREFNPTDTEKFKRLIELQNEFYFIAHPVLTQHNLSKGIDNESAEEMAKEDARYVLSLATEGQLGLTFSARTLEHAIRTMKYSELIEVQNLAQQLYDQASEIAPSLIKLTDPITFEKEFKRPLEDDMYKFSRKNLKSLVKEHTMENYFNSPQKEVKLTDRDPTDLYIVTAILHKYSEESWENCFQKAQEIESSEKRNKEFFRKVFEPLGKHDSLPREFEEAKVSYEIILSASAFAQLKRHRMSTLLSQDYNPGLSCTIPESITETGLEPRLTEICDQSSELFCKLQKEYGTTVSSYVLTNAHRRRVKLTTNIRELYHISRMRQDEHAQWDIRNIANQMTSLAQETEAISLALLGGKHEFEKIKENFYKD